MTSQYDDRGTPLSRTFHTASDDPDEIAQVQNLVTQLAPLISDGTYRITADTTPRTLPWAE